MTNTDTNQTGNNTDEAEGNINIDKAEISDNPVKNKYEEFANKQTLEFSANDLATLIKNLEKTRNALVKDLNERVQELKQQTYILDKLPEKIGEQLLSSVPQISEALHKRVFDDLDKEIDRVGARIDELSAKSDKWLNCYDKRITEACSKYEEKTTSINMVLQNIQTTTLKKKILSYITSTLFLFAIALSACALAFKYFPSKVNINEGNNITVQSSDVTVWGKDFKIIEKIREREGSRSVKQLK